MPTDLDDLLHAARNASPEDRISWRDPIASYGQQAIPAMRDWLSDAELGAFAVRVLEKIGEEPADRRACLEALKAADPESLTPAVARDVAAAMALGFQRAAPGAGGTRVAPKVWAGYQTASPLERRFHDDMLDIFRLAGEATWQQRPDGTWIRGYWASYFLRGVRNHGGLAYAHILLDTEGTTDGFKRLTDEGRLDLTMEALVLQPEYRELFSETERQMAASRLASAGYQPHKGSGA